MTLLKLFTIRDPRTNKRIPDLFFTAKPAARVKRDELNAAMPRDPQRPNAMPTASYTIATGPDHKSYKP